MRALRAYAWTVAAATWLLVVVGGTVTSTDSGLAVPDWPTTFGESMFDYPLSAMTGGVEYEHTHRLVASVVGLLTAILAVWTGLLEKRRGPRLLAAAAVFLVLVQGILGGLTVLLGLPATVSVAHGVLGQTFLGVLVAWVVSLAPARGATPVGVGGLAAATAFGVWVQLALGAILRHTGEGLAAHVAGAFAVAGLAHAAARRARASGDAPLGRTGRIVAGLVDVQILLGLLTWWRGAAPTDLTIGLQPILATAHVGVGAALLAASVAFALRAAPDPSRVADFALLARHRLTALVVVAAAAGFLAAGAGAPAAFLHVLLGTALLSAGASTLNQWLERDVDARMRRTANRPVPTGRVRPDEARRTGLALVAAGAAALLLGTNLLAAALGAATALLYLLVYTPLKKVTPLNTIVGAVPGALPVLIGWAAATGRLEAGAWALFGVLFLWQIPHFLAIASIHRDDYRAAGLAMLPALDETGAATGRQIVVFALALVPTSLFVLAEAAPAARGAALLLGIAFLAAGIGAAFGRTPALARRLLVASVLYLPAFLGVVLLGKVAT